MQACAARKRAARNAHLVPRMRCYKWPRGPMDKASGGHVDQSAETMQILAPCVHARHSRGRYCLAGKRSHERGGGAWRVSSASEPGSEGWEPENSCPHCGWRVYLRCAAEPGTPMPGSTRAPCASTACMHIRLRSAFVHVYACIESMRARDSRAGVAYLHGCTLADAELHSQGLGARKSLLWDSSQRPPAYCVGALPVTPKRQVAQRSFSSTSTHGETGAPSLGRRDDLSKHWHVSPPRALGPAAERRRSSQSRARSGWQILKDSLLERSKGVDSKAQ